jgi:hypothetical protein
VIQVAPSEAERDLHQLETELRRLETEYNSYFGGRLPRPPWETRSRVEALVKKIDRAYITNTGDRFRFHTLQSRYAKLVDLWDRALRAREEGRPGPLAQKRKTERDPTAPKDRVVHVSAFRDPSHEQDKLRDLYKSLVEARRQAGESSVPYQKFADLVQGQVKKLRAGGAPEVAFRITVKDGKVNFTARAVKERSD